MAGKQRKNQEQPLSFEDALARLEEIARQLEGEELKLEKAISLAEEGLKLSQFCEKQLLEAEGKIVQLVARMERVNFEPLKAEEVAAKDTDSRAEGPL